MTVKLLTEHYLEFASLKWDCTGSSESATLLEITCHGSIIISDPTQVVLTSNLFVLCACTNIKV